MPTSADNTLDLSNTLPREAPKALEILEPLPARQPRPHPGRQRRPPRRRAAAGGGAGRARPVRGAARRSRPGDRRNQPGADPADRLGERPSAVLDACAVTMLVTDNLTDLHPALVENPYNAKVKIELPSAGELADYLTSLVAAEPGLRQPKATSARRQLADKLLGLTRVERERPGAARLARRKAARPRDGREAAQGADREAGLRPDRVHRKPAHPGRRRRPRRGRAWLRQDAELLRRGKTRALPMGYLLAGRIGTGKTYLVTCWAGEIGMPVVEMKNFRDKWVGATEGNLETIFNILHALGQVIVFVDEADQATGKRGGGDGDSGLSGRIYGMLAKEMSDTRNRGKILWVFATSRPDLLEVDLKRQGRLDVHIPLFPPQDKQSRQDLFHSMARKVGLEIETKRPARAARRAASSAATRWKACWCSGAARLRNPERRRRKAAARHHPRGDRRFPPLGPRRKARADGPGRGQGMHRPAFPAARLPRDRPRPAQRKDRQPEAAAGRAFSAAAPPACVAAHPPPSW